MDAVETQIHVVPFCAVQLLAGSPSEESSPRELFVADVAMSASRLALMMVKRDPRRRRLVRVLR